MKLYTKIISILVLVCMLLGVQNNYAADTLKLAAPTSLKALETSSGAVKVSWRAVTGAAGYILYRSENKEGVYSYLVSTKDTSYTDNKFSDKKTYYYKLKSFKISNGVKIYSGFSYIVFAKANKLPLVPKAILKVGLDNTYQPMEYINENNKNAGFDIDFANEIGKRLNMEIKFVPNSWDSIFMALEQEKFDCIISSLTITEERKERYLLTQSYLANNQVIVTSAENIYISKLNDLQNKKVGVVIGTTGDEAGEEFNAEIPIIELHKYNELNDMLIDMKDNKLDAFLIDKIVAKNLVLNDNKKFKLTETSFGTESIGVCFRKDESELHKKVDNAISQMKKDGTLKEISKKWFAQDLSK